MKAYNEIRIPIGDWSDDGHGVCRYYDITSTHPVETLQDAYKASCKLTGVQFNHNDDYTGRIDRGAFHSPRLICTEYEERGFSDIVQEAFIKFGCPYEQVVEEKYFEDSEEFVKVLLWFISLSMPENFRYDMVLDDKKKYLNGFWNSNLNVQFGYGLFD